MEIKRQLRRHLRDQNFWMIVVENMISDNRILKYIYTDKKSYWKYTNSRDNRMALNLKWLSEWKYPGKKIIVWAHNYHISKYNGHYPEPILNNASTMGCIFTRDTILNNETYVLGFTSYQGTAGRVNQEIYKLSKPKQNSFERWIDPNYRYAFVDFKRYRLLNPSRKEMFYLAGSIMGNEHHTVNKALWTNIFDGIFYLKDMYPCKLVQRKN